ncbi:MAG: hypothetical protein RJB38_2356 [Pseudomonadota bacterium]|jgi:predicted AlkP superfamily pyrophosphatase or phosphodiesterase
MRTLLILALILGLCSVAPAAYAKRISYEQYAKKKPRLVLVLSVDQMRADYLTRFRTRFLPAKQKNGFPGGFQYLMSKGAYFPMGEYDVLQNMTGPGHAMILSGSYPYQMGIPLNDWFEPGRGPTYCVQDNASPVVTGGSKVPGLSPRNFLGSTLGDEIKNAGHPAKVVAVALKDRAAILLGGHRADLALWFDGKSLQWTTSRYYLPQGDLPSWIQKLSEKPRELKGQRYVWKANEKTTGLSISGDEAFERTTTFGSYESLGFPWGAELTIDTAIAATNELKLGQGVGPDVLAVSLSSHDYLAHQHGANSRELEEMTVAEDRLLSRLLGHLQKTIPGGLSQVAIALTADHGGPSAPAWLASQGMTAGDIDEDALLRASNEKLNAVFGKPKSGKSYLRFVSDLNFFLDPEVLTEKNLDPAKVQREALDFLVQTPGVLTGFTKSEHRLRLLPGGLFERQATHGFFPPRSGDIVLIPKPFFQSAGSPVSHQTGYAYDRTVPIILVASGIKAGVYPSRANVIDIAPTLSFLLGVLPPAMSEGRVLEEIFEETKAVAVKDPG